MADVCVEKLKRLLDYHQETGKFFWRERGVSDCADPSRLSGWNTRFAGLEAGRVKSHGYRVFSLGVGNLVLAHRAAFAMTHGRWPKMIDHINGDRGDNRIENLREVTPSENQRNRTKSKNNSSGLSGLRWSKGRKKWDVYAWLGGRSKKIGRFNCFGEAVKARAVALRCAGFSARHGL